MKPLCSLLFFILVHATCVVAHAEINSSGVMGFQIWKTSRIEDARATLEKIQADAQVDRPQAIRPQDAKRSYQKYQQAQLNLQIVQELTISDYFTLYLSQLKDRSTMIDAARKLSAEDVADLMAAYQKALTSMTTGSTSDRALPLLASPSPQSKLLRLHD